MLPMYYIGLDVHKRKISYCVKDSGGKVFAEGSPPATRLDLDNQKNLHPRSSIRVRRAFALLTKTYHGSRVTGQVQFQDFKFPITAAGSDGRRNTGLQFTRRSFEA
jgi:hypothetical protein